MMRTGRILSRLSVLLVCCTSSIPVLAQGDKKIIEGSKSLQQSYDKLGVLLEKNKDSIISSRLLRKNLKQLNNSTDKYFRLPDSMLNHYSRLTAYRSIDSLLRTRTKSLPKKYVASFLSINQINNHIKQVKDLEHELTALYKTDIRSLFTASYLQNMIRHDGFSAIYSGQTGQSFFGDQLYYTNHLQVADNLSFGNVPLSMGYIYQQYSNSNFYDRHVLNVTFDKEAFLDNYRRKIAGKLKPEDILPRNNLLDAAVASATSMLHKELDSIKKMYSNAAGAFSEKLSAVQDLATTDINTIRQKLLGNISLQSIADKERILKEIELKATGGQQIDHALKQKLQDEVSEEKAALSLFDKVAEHKRRWESGGLIKKIIDDKELRSRSFRDLLSNPASVRDIAGEHFQMGGIEKFLMNVNSFKGGRQASSLSALSLNNFLSDGMSMEMQSGKKYLYVLFGRQQQFNSLYDAASFSPLQPQNNMAMGLRIGTGELAGTHSHFSIFSYNNQPFTSTSSYSNALNRSSVVLGLSNKLVSGPSTVAVEVSHSSMKFRNEGKGDFAVADPVNQNDDNRRFGDGLAIDVQYDAAYEDVALDISVNGTITGENYFNPGNAFLTQGMRQLTLAAKKSFYKNKLQLRIRDTWRQLDFAQASGNKWRQNMLLLDARYQLGGGQYISFQYQPMRSVKIDDNAKYRMGMTDRVSAEINFVKQFNNIMYRSLAGLSHNKNFYSGSIGSAYQVQSNAVQINSIQSLILKKHVLYWNVLYSHVYQRSNAYYLNNQFNADAGLTYTLLKKLQASSGLNYNSVKGWYALAGVRQTLSASVGEKLQLNLFVDWRAKVKETQHYYNEPLRADCSVRYIF